MTFYSDQLLSTNQPIHAPRWRAHSDKRRETEVAVAVHALNRMLELGRLSYVRVA